MILLPEAGVLGFRSVLGLGTNCGDRLGFLRGAIARLVVLCPEIRIQKISSIYESDAMLPEGAPTFWNRPFLNLALVCETQLSPHALLDKAKGIERAMGRVSRDRWAPREIDIDLLTFSDRRDGYAVVDASDLRVPHPGLLERPFSLLPLVEVWPDWIFPDPSYPQAFGKTACELASRWRWVSPEDRPFRTRRTADSLTELVGIVNVTPDSFSDGGNFLEPERAIAHALELTGHGATVLDIGAESTRPGALPLTESEEWLRLQPVLRGLRSELETGSRIRPKISVDTRHPSVALRAMGEGADWINDVTGLDQASMREAVASSSTVDVVVMHHLGVPPDRGRVLSRGESPLDQLVAWGSNKIQALETYGIDRSRIILDPGIGFGKDPHQAFQILEGAHRLHSLGVRILIGHSRKSFLASITDEPAPHRDLETIAVSMELASQGIQYLRVHDVKGHWRALRGGSFLRKVDWAR